MHERADVCGILKADGLAAINLAYHTNLKLCLGWGFYFRSLENLKKKLHALGTALKTEVWCQESNNPFPPGSDLELREQSVLLYPREVTPLLPVIIKYGD